MSIMDGCSMPCVIVHIELSEKAADKPNECRQKHLSMDRSYK